ncbi:MAG: hypothetical protein ABJC66_17610 [Gammaproteobacteria bacterium]
MHATPPSHRVRYSWNGLRRVFIGAVLFGVVSDAASAYTVSLTAAAPKSVYLQVGVGSFTNTYLNGGQPGNNTTVNSVSVSVPATVVGNGTVQTMTTNSTAAISFWDNYTFCSVPGQVYIGGFYRTTGGNTTAAQVSATVPAALTSATGQTIPFSKIRWTTSGNGDTGAQPFPAGTFVNGGVQNVGAMSSNTWNESCWAFTYSNDSVPAAGTFSGTVRYTLSSP